MSKLHVMRRANLLLNKFGRHVEFRKIDRTIDTKKIRLNLGSGNWSCKGWVNLDYPSEWFRKMQKGHKIVPYDIRNDSIPFGDNSVNTIYCSHVVEHIEDIHIQKMFNECYRVLLGGGVLRIVCPDAEFLYNMAKEDKAAAYWSWGDTCFNSPLFAGKYSGKNLPRIVDYLVRELAIPKLPGYAGYINAISNGDYAKAFREMEMYDFFEFLTKDLTFRVEYGGDHINYWTFDKMKKMLTKAGFDFVIQSRYGASCCPEMRQMHKFDLCAPFVSLYVEAIK